MDNKSLEMLEFPHIRNILASYTSFSASHSLALELKPHTDKDEISSLLQQAKEARHLFALLPEFSIGGVIDIREEAELAERGKVLDCKTLLNIQQSLAATSRLKTKLINLEEEIPSLYMLASEISVPDTIERELGNCIREPGELLSTASPHLVEIRSKIKQVRNQLIDQLQSIIESTHGKKIIQEPIIEQREERYVILVKVENRKEIKGIIHDTSNSGATVYIEPWAVVEQGNTLREFIAEEQREVERILRDLSAQVGVYKNEIFKSIEKTACIDLALAKARFAREYKASEPELITSEISKKTEYELPSPSINLIEARHPLLGEKAVPLTVSIGDDYSILVITGPNTGGKTVALKTIGLLSIMAQSGIPVTASERSCFPIFDNIFADIGDEQSIEQTLSTFSWHMTNVVHIINQSTRKSLVLLDELGGSTDPIEGSALACSILQHFLKQGTKTVATTHYSNLKTFAYSHSGLRNASFDFDPDTLMPTYHLTIGIPGGSNALATADRLGLPPDIITGAKEMISTGAMDLNELLTDLMKEKRKVEELHFEINKQSDALREKRTEWEEKIKVLQEIERNLSQEGRDRVIRKSAELEKEIRQAISALKKERSKQGIQNARRAISDIEKRLTEINTELPVLAKVDEDEDNYAEIKIGDKVQIRGTNAIAEVISIADKSNQFQIQIGQTKLWLRQDSFEKIEVPEDATSKPHKITVKKELQNRSVSLELNLRGKRAEEVEWALESYLSNAIMANLKQVSIIHGYGTGTVRSITREFLAGSPLVKSFRSGELNEGGDGVTIVNL